MPHRCGRSAKDDGDTLAPRGTAHVERVREPFGRLASRLDREGIAARVPWLYGLKVDFRFR